MPDNKPRRLPLLSDVPVGEQHGSINALNEESLNFKAYARVLAHAALDTEDTLTIGVYGKWGTGKTTLMRLMNSIVEEEKDRAVAVWFNAWQYEREEHLIIPLTATIAQALEEQEKKWTETVRKTLADGTRKLGAALRSILYGFTSVEGEVSVPHVLKAKVKLSPKDMIKRYQDLTKDAALSRSLYFDAFRELRELARNEEVKKPKIVVFIDDLDRCFPDRAVQLLEGIKLVLCQPGFSFVLGIYREIIEAFVRVKYTKEHQLDPHLFDGYLDKIVQVAVDVPERKAAEMADYIKGLIKKGDVFPDAATDPMKMKDIVSVVGDACAGNPRSVVRLLNDVLVFARIAHQERKEEYNTLTLLIDRAVRMSFKPLLKALDERAAVQPEEGGSAIDLDDYLAGVIARESGRADLYSLRDHFETLLRRQDPGGLSGNALKTLVGSEALRRLLSSDVGRKWLSDRAYRESLGKTAPRERAEAERSQDKVDWDTIRRLVEVDGENPLSFPEVIDGFLKRGSSLPYWARTHVTSLDALQGLTALKSLDLRGCTGVTSLEPLQRLTALESLVLSDCTGVTSLEPLQRLTTLELLLFYGCTGVTSLEPLRGLTALKNLYLLGCTGVTSLEPLRGLTALKNLYLLGCTGVTSLEPLHGLTALKSLNLSGCAGVTSLEPLQGLTALRDLSFSGCTGVTSLEPLQGLAVLWFVDLSGCAGVTDLRPLVRLPNLREVYLKGSGVDPRNIPAELLEKTSF